jgi:hypothetical protein
VAALGAGVAATPVAGRDPSFETPTPRGIAVTLCDTKREGTEGHGRRCLGAAALASTIAILLAFAPSALAATFTVNSTGDAHDLDFGSTFDGVCDTDATAAVVCTLRAAIEESNANGGAVVDAIDFNTGAMGVDPTITVAVGTTGSYPVITGEVNINGCSANLNSTTPCVGLRSDTAGSGTGLNFNVGGAAGAFQASVDGLALTNWGLALRYSDFGHGNTTFNAQNNYFGTKRDGTTAEANGFGFSVVGGNATIGGPEDGAGPTERNVFSNNGSTALQIASGDNGVIQGNYFGTTPAGTAAASPGNAENIEVAGNTTTPSFNNPDNTQIGGTVTAAQHATNVCDGVCNVIAGANGAANTGFGIDLQGEPANSEVPAGSTTIAGNFVGLKADGTALVNATVPVVVGNADGVTIGGANAEDRNYITGGVHGITTVANPDDLVVRNNFIGLNPAGTALLSPPSSTGMILSSSSAADPPTIADNRIALATTGDNPIQISNSINTVVTGNVIGIGTGGQELSSGSIAIRTAQMNGATITGNTIGNATGAGLRMGLTLEGSDNNVVRGNFIGTDSLGADYGNAGPGIRIAEFFSNASTGNVIGGDNASDENVISNNAGDAIEVLDESSDNNEFRRNRGSGNGGLFIDLNGDGPDPGIPAHGVNDGVAPPAITSADANSASGTAMPNAVVRLFSKASSSPGEVEGFVGQATADGTGAWTINHGSSLPAGKLIAATQTLPATPPATESTSELSAAFSTVVPSPPGPGPGPGPEPGPQPGDTEPPETTITGAPKDKTKKKTASFQFGSSEPGSTFECKLDDGAFQSCSSPRNVKVKKGKHSFQVRATDAAGNIDPTPATDTWKVKKPKK